MYNQSNLHYGAIGTAGMVLPQQPKTPGDIYGFAQKAILHSIFDKQIHGGSNGNPAVGTAAINNQKSKNHGGASVKTRHTTPFISNIG